MTEPEYDEPVVDDEDGHTDPCEHREPDAPESGVTAEAVRPSR